MEQMKENSSQVSRQTIIQIDTRIQTDRQTRCKIVRHKIQYYYSLSTITVEAITAMTQVARYINEVQKVSELYAHLFDGLLLKSGLAEVISGPETVLLDRP